MQGILIVDKPVDFTSFDVVAKLRGILNTRKIGHSGTLDPMATGVLPCFIGIAAKAVDMQSCHDKAYEATVRFGISTDTGDITGTVLRTDDKADISEAQFVKALEGIVGKQMQLPPMYSAVKIGGVPLYKSARKGEVIERTPREIEVYGAEYLQQIKANEYRFYVECSKGSYVRTMCEDIGDKLSVPATMSNLRRVKAGTFTLANAHTLSEIQAAKDNGTLDALLLPVGSLFAHLDTYELNEEGFTRLLNGAICKTELPNARYRLVHEGGFVGVCEINEGVLAKVKLFCERE